jgi:hypothetical protein
MQILLFFGCLLDLEGNHGEKVEGKEKEEMEAKEIKGNKGKRQMQVKTQLQQGPVDPRTRRRNE